MNSTFADLSHLAWRDDILADQVEGQLAVADGRDVREGDAPADGPAGEEHAPVDDATTEKPNSEYFGRRSFGGFNPAMEEAFTAFYKV